MRLVSDEFLKNIKTHILYSIFYFFFSKSCRLRGNVGKRDTADESITHSRKDVICMPDNKGTNPDTHS